MKKMLNFHSFKYVDKKDFIFYIFINIFDVFVTSAMPLITKLMIDSVISLNLKRFIYMIMLEVIFLILFLCIQTIKDYIHEKLHADNFIKVSKRVAWR